MANIKSYPNNIDQYIGAEEVMKWHHGRTSGVYAAGTNCAVEAVSGQMAVTVSDGNGWLTDANGNGIVWWNDYFKQHNTKLQLTISPAESTGQLSRKDRIIVEWTIGLYDAVPVIRVLEGTSASTPTVPALTNSSTVRQISLAQILIPAAATEITAVNITDERTDNTVCGLVTETVTADTSAIHTQYLAALAELRSAIEEAWSGEISAGAVSMYYTGSIPQGSWTASGDAYYKEVTLNGIRADDHPIVDLMPAAAIATAEAQIEGWGYIYKVTASAANVLTFYATDVPSVALPIQVRCIRK